MEISAANLTVTEQPHRKNHKVGVRTWLVDQPGYEKYKIWSVPDMPMKVWYLGGSPESNRYVCRGLEDMDEALVFILLHRRHVLTLEQVSEIVAQEYLEACDDYGFSEATDLHL